MLEQQLHAQADAEQRHAQLRNDLIEPVARSRRIASPAAPTPGNSTRRRGGDLLRSIADDRARAQALEREVQRGQVGAAAVDDDRHRSQRALGARQVVALAPQRRTQRPADALEARLDHVMGVLAAHGDLQRRAQALCERAEEVRYQFGRQLADLLAAEVALEDEVRPARQIDRDLRLLSSMASRKP